LAELVERIVSPRATLEFMEVAAAIGFDPCALIRSLDRKIAHRD
jgi:hypothetical protein